MFLWLRKTETRGRAAVPFSFLRIEALRLALAFRLFALMLFIALHLPTWAAYLPAALPAFLKITSPTYRIPLPL